MCTRVDSDRARQINSRSHARFAISICLADGGTETLIGERAFGRLCGAARFRTLLALSNKSIVLLAKVAQRLQIGLVGQTHAQAGGEESLKICDIILKLSMSRKGLLGRGGKVFTTGTDARFTQMQ